MQGQLSSKRCAGVDLQTEIATNNQDIRNYVLRSNNVVRIVCRMFPLLVSNIALTCTAPIARSEVGQRTFLRAAQRSA